jgi:hypothetical protein
MSITNGAPVTRVTLVGARHHPIFCNREVEVRVGSPGRPNDKVHRDGCGLACIPLGRQLPDRHFVEGLDISVLLAYEVVQ